MKKTLFLACSGLILFSFAPFWGFFAHQKINRLAIFTLPPEMIGFYKHNIQYITKAAVNPDRRRYAVPEEGARHYLDLDHYGDSAATILPQRWDEAVRAFGEDTLQTYGILPWHINRMYLRLRNAFMVKDPGEILRTSAELGHYVADAHVPLHTTENYNGQLTGQEGIHGFWESRLPELYHEQYNFFTGKAEYLTNPQASAWEIIFSTHALVRKVLEEERKLAALYGEKRYSFETRGNLTVKVYAEEYAAAYHKRLRGMVEQQMRASVRMTGNIWFTAWVDAGQPDLTELIHYTPADEELLKRQHELKQMEHRFNLRPHE
jgi:hypothetical protein